MTLQEAYKLTGAKTKAALGRWFPEAKTRAAVSKWDEQDLPPIVEREIKDVLSAKKQERAADKQLKKENAL